MFERIREIVSPPPKDQTFDNVDTLEDLPVEELKSPETDEEDASNPDRQTK
jgi:hypothetical protein